MLEMKITSFSVVVVLLCISGSINSQKIDPQSINGCSKTVKQSNGSLSFTVGNLIVATQSDANGNTLGNGFTVGSTVTVSGIKEHDASSIDVSIFPNPTDDWIYIDYNLYNLNELSISITDMFGKVLFQDSYSNKSNTIGINTSSFNSGIYILSLKNISNQILGTYKIIKK